MHLTRTLFEQNLRTKFWLHDPEGTRAALDLVEVQKSSAPPPYEVFSLVFRGDGDRIHPQRIYAIEHEAIGAFDLFLVPVGRNQHGIVYEAVFNRVSSDQS
jgi:uncharacterized protein DUF6916